MNSNSKKENDPGLNRKRSLWTRVIYNSFRKVSAPETSNLFRVENDVDTEMTALFQAERGIIDKFKGKLNKTSSASKDSKVGEDGGICVVCIGSTGTGKSSTVSKCTGRYVPSGSGRDKVTNKCGCYTCTKPIKTMAMALDNADKIGTVWVDTVGWDDAELRDDNTFKDILSFIAENHLLCVKAIIWNILPNVRRDGTLSSQAKMINMFKEKDIWNNVIIVCKKSRDPEEDAQGALAAAKCYNATATIPRLGFTYIDDASFTQRQRQQFEDKQTREDFLVKTDSEVAELIHATIAQLGPPIQVVFKNQQCLDCSEIGDARLMSRFCHMERVSVHSGNIIQYHPGVIEKHHESSKFIREHEGGLYRPWYSCDFLFCKFGGDRYICCRSLSDQPGCKAIRLCCKQPFVSGDDAKSGCVERYSCCHIRTDSGVAGCETRFECCGRRVNSSGCVDICKKCDAVWGTPAGNCFEKQHAHVVFIDKETDD